MLLSICGQNVVRTSPFDNNLSMKQEQVVFPLGLLSNWTITFNLVNDNKHEGQKISTVILGDHI